MHGIHPQIAGPSLRIGPAPFSNGHPGGPRPGIVQSLLPVLGSLPQVVQMCHRDRGQPLMFWLAITPVFALEAVTRPRSTPPGMSFIYAYQPFDLCGGMAV